VFLNRNRAWDNKICEEFDLYIKQKTVLWNRNYFLRFRFRFRLLKSYGSSSGSDFRKSYGSGSDSGSYFRKITVLVLVPVPAPCLDHKKQIFLIFFAFLHSKLFYANCCQVLLPIILLMAWTTEQERTISWQVGLYLTILIVNLSNTTMIVLAVRHLNQESQGINGGERYRYS
jgi:hypothetical protein